MTPASESGDASVPPRRCATFFAGPVAAPVQRDIRAIRGSRSPVQWPCEPPFQRARLSSWK
jgi:hypothetical protein